MIIKIIVLLIFVFIIIGIYINVTMGDYKEELEDLDIENTVDEYQQILKLLQRTMPKFFK